MKPSFTNEMQNYWKTRLGVCKKIRAIWFFGAAVLKKLWWKHRGLETHSGYIRKESLKSVPLSGTYKVIKLARPKQRLDVFKPGKDLVVWAEHYQCLYDDFLNGKYKASADPEEYWTLHQFGWVIVLFLDGQWTQKQVIDAILIWISRLGTDASDAAWRSFSISERLCNWYYISHLIQLGPAEGVIAESMAYQAHYLSQHLEFMRGGQTNNHLINNGRALYLTGLALDYSECVDVGKQILLEEAERQFTSDGFLDEGSTHYQLIFTRAYLDALHAAGGFKDLGFQQLLRPKVQLMLCACGFFLDKDAPNLWQIPFFGDISPDPPPVLFDRSTQFWNYVDQAQTSTENWLETCLDKFWFESHTPDGSAAPSAGGWHCFPASGYYHWACSDYKIWWHARKQQHHQRRHSHNDWGSFQLHFGGLPVIIDPGRETYALSKTIYDSRLTLVQNSLAIDGFEQALFLKRDLFDPKYLACHALVGWEARKEDGFFSLDISAYHRLASPVAHRREFLLQLNQVIIEDHLTGKGVHTVQVAFHLHPDIHILRNEGEHFELLLSNGYTIELALAAGGKYTVKQGGMVDSPGGYCSPMYDQRIETNTIFATYVCELPQKLITQIILKNSSLGFKNVKEGL